MTNKEIRQKIIDYNNEKKNDRNILKVFEESMELNEALVKYLTKQPEDRPSLDKIIEEAGDVFFRLRILTQMLGIEEGVKERYLFKHVQLKGWMEEKYEGTV